MFYEHYKGGIYYTLGIIRYEENKNLFLNKTIKATHTEDNVQINILLGRRGYLFTDCEEYTKHVLYLGEDGRLWARPFDSFFGTVEIDGVKQKRFELII